MTAPFPEDFMPISARLTLTTLPQAGRDYRRRTVFWERA
jgi:hypothetical protein